MGCQIESLQYINSPEALPRNNGRNDFIQFYGSSSCVRALIDEGMAKAIIWLPLFQYDILCTIDTGI